MTWHRYLGPLMLIVSCGTAAGDYVVGVGAEVDTENGYALAGFGELAIADSTWLSAGGAISRTNMGRTDVADSSFDAVDADLELDHLFERWHLGIRLGVLYWGDSGVLDSVGFRSAVYLEYPRFSLSADFEHRNYDLVLDLPLLRASRTAEFDADGVGFHGRLDATDHVSLYAGAMWYDYSRHASLRPRIDELRFLSLSRLILGNGLVDRKSHAGIEIALGARLFDVSYARWQSTAAAGGSVDSFGLGFLTPLGPSSDIEFRVSREESEAFGDSTILSVFLYFAGR